MGSLALLLSSRGEVRDHNLFDRMLAGAIAPGQWLVVQTVEGARRAAGRYLWLRGVEADNRRLRADNALLRQQVAELDEAGRENTRLRQLLDLVGDRPQRSSVLAQIIATSSNPLFRSVRIDRGLRHGVRLGSAVISPDGVVGRIAAVGTFTSEVMLLVDNNSSVDVMVQRTRAHARVRGLGGDGAVRACAEHLARTADVLPGDGLITSGLGDTFPKGLRVGTVVSTESRAFGLYQSAEVEPSVDFSRLESLMVLRRAEPQAEPLPEQAELRLPEAGDLGG